MKQWKRLESNRKSLKSEEGRSYHWEKAKKIILQKFKNLIAPGTPIRDGLEKYIKSKNRSITINNW